MYCKIYIVFILILVFSQNTKAQVDYQKTDSIATAYYDRGEWKLLLNFGKMAISNGEDFPDLRLKMGHAAFNLGAYSLALTQYQKVLNNDRYHQTALYYAYLCNTYLNRPLDASILTKKLNEKTINERIQKSLQLVSIGFENSFKSTNTTARGSSVFTRLHAQLQVIEQLHIDQSISLFSQSILNDKIKLSGYYIKVNYMPISSFTLIGVYNYSSSTYLFSNYQNNAALFGIKYSHPYFNFQGDINFSRLNNESIRQISFQLFNYLSGNLNLYTINRLAMVDSATVYAGTLGAKVTKNMWAEVSSTFGLQKNYTETDGLYQFNGIDNTTAKYGINAYFLVKKHLLLNIGYSIEKKESETLSINYSQKAINTGIKWNF